MLHETREPEIYSTTPAAVFKLGGTWDMAERPDGKLIGTGNLGDDEISRLEARLGLHSEFNPSRIATLERELARNIYSRFKATQPEHAKAGQHLSEWCPEFSKFVDAPFYAYFSGDSAHFRPALVAPMTAIVLEHAIKKPRKPILGGHGTDTADIALMSVLDTLVYDTNLPPFIFTGANRSWREANSDAPQNFLDLARVSNVGLDSGAYWVFDKNLYKPADLVKIDPQETRRIENQSTFFAPRQSNVAIDDLVQQRAPQEYQVPDQNHVVNQLNIDNLFDALNSVGTVDVGNQNPTENDVEQILNPNQKVIVIAAHSLGSVNNVIKAACVEAAKRGKIVIDSSRCLIGVVDPRYGSSLLDVNDQQDQLAGTDKRILTAYQLNKAVARAVAVRAVLEKLDQPQTQRLIKSYCEARGMI